MENKTNYEQDLASIRQMMERTSKFLSLSGISGVLAGTYALFGASYAYYLLYYPSSPFGNRSYQILERTVLWQLVLIACIVLIASVLTAYWFTYKKAQKKGLRVWDRSSKNLFVNFSIPLAVGGLFILALLFRGYTVIAAPASLIFYGIALVNASYYTYGDVRYLGFCQIILGLISAFIPGYSLVFWALGFGVMHILYGFLMYRKYDLEK